MLLRAASSWCRMPCTRELLKLGQRKERRLRLGRIPAWWALGLCQLLHQLAQRELIAAQERRPAATAQPQPRSALGLESNSRPTSKKAMTRKALQHKSMTSACTRAMLLQGPSSTCRHRSWPPPQHLRFASRRGLGQRRRQHLHRVPRASARPLTGRTSIPVSQHAQQRLAKELKFVAP